MHESSAPFQTSENEHTALASPTMSSIEAVLQQTIDSLAREAIIKAIRDHQEWTIADLVKHFATGPHAKLAGTITVGDLGAGGSGAPVAPARRRGRPRRAGSGEAAGEATVVEGKASKRGKSAKAGKSAKGRGRKAAAAATEDRASAPRGRRARVNVRTPAGRESFDEAVYAALSGLGEQTKAPALLAAVGGSETQLRASLRRLAKAKRISIGGKARGTHYSAK